MATLYGKSWSKTELLSYIGDVAQVAGIRPSILRDGKAEGVSAVDAQTGAGLQFTVLPGRGMDIPDARYRGIPLHFASGTGITAPAYYEEPGLGWLRSFFVGLLTTCGITYSGQPDNDQGEALGLHGRISNAGAENIGVNQEWQGDEYVMTIQGMLRECRAMGEFMTLTRRIETRLGWKKFILTDIIENRGFAPQPLMMLYHFNFGFPLLGPNASVVAPILKTEPRNEQARQDNGVAECLSVPAPIHAYQEKVFFHDLAADDNGQTFMALLNPDIGNGQPLGVIERFNIKQLPKFTQWKMPCQGFYVMGLEPGTVTPIGRSALRKENALPMLDAQAQYQISIEIEVIDTLADFEQIRQHTARLVCKK
ncbi:conserved predicted protein [Candidatus Moduliflexus flocculans]|uniref:DUF4432 domain-containing protein n=1 Tax=Candidatus Moduliflexus flocculans TaxID=1499966 RepID=A0A081BPU4_9BACT|nr:conserved predicted protein [Candidatus Moduliflexus flocculans]